MHNWFYDNTFQVQKAQASLSSENDNLRGSFLSSVELLSGHLPIRQGDELRMWLHELDLL